MSDLDSLHTVQIRSGDQITGLRRNRLRLEVTRGPDKNLRRDLESDHVVVGSHETCDLQLSDPTVSRQHFEVVLVPAGYRIRDLDSLNGLKIEGMRVFDAVVDRPTTIEIGSTTIKLAATSDSVELPLSTQTRCGPLLGRSAQMRRVFDILRKVAPTPTTVLLTGESGTGKEVAARAIHELSSRSEGPFIVVDCAALPPTLIESELYGHERGAFTGADRSRKGAFEEAAGGTLFLDEIGELPLDLQTRLLGAIERRQVQPLGGAKARPIDVRLVAATNRDLRREVNRGTFRSDLYFRLAVVTVEMPALRDRPEDIPLYVESFIQEYSAEGQPLQIDPATIQALQKQPWPGNVRELRNALERAAALGEVETPPPSQVPAASPNEEPTATALSVNADPAIPFKTGKAMLVQTYERAYVEALMAKHEGNITRAARAAEIDRVYLLRLLDKFDMRPTKQGPKKS
jgi:DNA-binding NtrC family response regulator